MKASPVTTQQELEELLHSPEKFDAYLTGRAQEMFGDVGTLIKDQLSTTLKQHGVKRLPMSAPADGPGGSNGSGEFGRFGEFLRAAHPATIAREGFDSRLEKLAVDKALNEGQGDQGGFVVPEEFRGDLLSLSMEQAIVRPRAFTIPMATPTVRVPTIRDTTHASNVFGGVQAYWLAESGSVTASEPTFAQLALTAKKLTGYTTVSNELLMDSAIPLEALLNRLFGEAIMFFEDDAFLNGDGAGEPLGILGAGCTVSVAKESGQAATTVVWENIVNMYSRMLPSSLNRAVWVAHNDTFPQLATMSLAVGTGGSAVWINNGIAGPPMTILGRPVLFTEKCKTLGTTGDIYFADFGYYVIGDRQSLTVSASPHVRFTNDETVYRFVERLDGRPWLESAITPRNGSNTLSPFVKLDTRA